MKHRTNGKYEIIPYYSVGRCCVCHCCHVPTARYLPDSFDEVAASVVFFLPCALNSESKCGDARYRKLSEARTQEKRVR